jgi:hypothetical protein
MTVDPCFRVVVAPAREHRVHIPVFRFPGEEIAPLDDEDLQTRMADAMGEC